MSDDHETRDTAIPEGAPEGFPYTPDEIEKARERVEEWDDTIKHNRVLTREQRLGQFILGAGKLTPVVGILGLATQKAVEVINGTGRLDWKVVGATAIGAAIGGIRRIRGRSVDASRIRKFAQERFKKASSGSPAS